MKEKLQCMWGKWKQKLLGTMVVRFACMPIAAVIMLSLVVSVAVATGSSNGEDVMYG